MDQDLKRLHNLGIHVPDILLPKTHVDLSKWAVVACDQYTSEPEYWQEIDDLVDDHPSTLRLIYPEVYLHDENRNSRIDSINETMRAYLDADLFDTYHNAFFLVNRKTPKGLSRWGLMINLDLEFYDYNKTSRSLIRATEETIESRIPPRKQIRKDSSLELPHVMILFNDPTKSIIEPLSKSVDSYTQLYCTTLMGNGGTITTYLIPSHKVVKQLADAFDSLYEKLDPQNRLLFAMGDGNHSLATAKSCWNSIKEGLTKEEIKDHPARFALVEIENIFDEGLLFEAIHRLLSNTSRSQFFGVLNTLTESYTITEYDNILDLTSILEQENSIQHFGYIDEEMTALVTLEKPSASICAETIQILIDKLLEQGSEVDYVHGFDVPFTLGKKEGNIGLIMPSISKDTFFDAILDMGSFPRKTFSLGEANEKRFYLEARKIVPT